VANVRRRSCQHSHGMSTLSRQASGGVARWRSRRRVCHCIRRIPGLLERSSAHDFAAPAAHQSATQ
jgi:hypothetical protein